MRDTKRCRHFGIEVPAQLPEELDLGGREKDRLNFGLGRLFCGFGRDESHPYRCDRRGRIPTPNFGIPS